MKKWTVQIVGKDEESVIAHIKAMLATFEISVKFNKPVHFLELENKGTSLTCKEILKVEDI